MRHFHYPTKPSVESQMMASSSSATGYLLSLSGLSLRQRVLRVARGKQKLDIQPQYPTLRCLGTSAGWGEPRGRNLPGGACEPRGSHSRGYPAPGLDRGADRCTRAPRGRREAAPSVTAVKRKWRRELAHASRGLEEPRPRGPARRHTARSRHSPSRSLSESRCGVVKGEWRAAGSRTGSSDACRGPRGSGPGKPEEGSKDTNLRGTGVLVAAATAHH